ncbi:MAG TPA: galactokinase family protein, partial [Lacipirellulaceae bacterium]|nr:galactokinase family protein [Lacipirellulaceae bacterium]
MSDRIMPSFSPTNDFAAAVERLRQLPQDNHPGLQSFFERHAQIHVARAPGRLDVMGGIGDYSGSLVLEMPIAEAAFAAVQKSTAGDIRVASLSRDNVSKPRLCTIESARFLRFLRSDYSKVRDELRFDPEKSSLAYVLGPILVLLKETNAELQGGLRVLIDSQVPEGKGVSSSAAVEVATMRAVAAALKIELPGEEFARLCQIAENHIVGAPCGIMDQMTSALACEQSLLALRCQPAIVEEAVPIPPQIAFWGIDSGISHAVSGADYSSVRCGAFMGYRIIAEAAGLPAQRAVDSPDLYAVDDPQWHGYLANISPHEYRQRFAAIVPEEMTGREFIARYGGTTDRVTRVEPDRTYAVRFPTLHPIEENARAEL